MHRRADLNVFEAATACSGLAGVGRGIARQSSSRHGLHRVEGAEYVDVEALAGLWDGAGRVLALSRDGIKAVPPGAILVGVYEERPGDRRGG